MSENVVAVDFGLEQRLSAQRLARLLGMLEERDADMLTNPKKYFDLAANEIIRLQAVLRAAQEAINPLTSIMSLDWHDPRPSLGPPAISIDADEYARLKALQKIIEGHER